MSDADDRLTTLEIRAAEQEKLIEELSGQLAEQWSTIERLQKKLDVRTERFLTLEEPLKRAVYDLVRDFGGSFSAEHGIGRLKVGELERYASAAELELMRAVKRAFDPNGIMNPGKVLSSA